MASCDDTGALPEYVLGVNMTCHNRRETTMRCLRALAACELPPRVRVEVFLVDDGSQDGTASAVAEAFPSVHLLAGDGSLFWAGGTREAMRAAQEYGVDGHLWLNDDSFLDADALMGLLAVASDLEARHGTPVIVVGSMRDPLTGRPSYGGVRQRQGWHPLKFELVLPTEEPQLVDTMNGNLVLVPASVVAAIGVLHEDYVHAIGDFGYGFEARLAGVSVWAAPGTHGTCARTEVAMAWLEPSLTLRDRWARIRGPKGLPLRAYGRLARVAGARPWRLFAILPYLRVIVTGVVTWLGRTFRIRSTGVA